MPEALKVANLYFEASNRSDFDEISKLLTDSTTYASTNTGTYIGCDAILEMQRDFHGNFSKLNWEVNSVKEERPGVVVFDYSFSAVKKSGDKVEARGIEYVFVKGGKIQHVEIKNK